GMAGESVEAELRTSAGGAAAGAGAGAGAGAVGAGGAAGVGAAGAGAAGAGGAGAAGTGAAGAGGAASVGVGAGGAGAAGGGVLAATGAKVAVAVGTATVVAAGGGTAAYVAAGDDDPAVRPVAAVTTVRSSSPIPGRPVLQVQNAQIVRVSGLPDGPVLQRANAALRAPLDRQIASFRRYIAGSHTGANVPRCATVGSKAAVHYSGPRLVSVFYSFQTRSCSVADETPGLMDTVTVDLRTGRALGPADILRDYSAAGIAAVARAMPPSTEENRYCLDGPLRRAHFEPDASGGPAVAPMQITFTPNSLRLNYVVPQVECWSGGTWNVPYARAGELIKPDVAALLPSAPSPGRT
ncbi:hypothetical protein, partial [Spirillospora sp. NPDC029432]|uniref:hypothetical protein n=1 Tax=Spirillospora sp. NPDC029432 TaxID=3154599 RepID=UPI003452CB2D